jgi:hypothetical protein
MAKIIAMGQIKYHTRRSGGIFFLVLGGLYFGIMVGLGIVPMTFLPVWIVAAVFILIATYLLFGMYTVIANSYVQLVQFPFINVKINYDQITHVSLQGKPFFANSVRTLFIVAKAKSISHFFFLDPQGVFRVGSDVGYGNDVIASIIKSIGQNAPHAQIDPMARAFVNLADSRKYNGSIPYNALREEADRLANNK